MKKTFNFLTGFLAIFLFIFSSNIVICYSGASVLDSEPIDVVIKYIDLTDANLKRDGIPQIKKDEDNDELKYAVRSVLKNAPWVNKIYIIMPNEKVRYFKDADKINDKIVYIKDKDLLGYDSASVTPFLFNLWKLADFGVSKNFIYMDDDCFFGKSLKKSDFFYIDNDNVVPYVIYSEKLGNNSYSEVYEYYKNLEKNIQSEHPHASNGFRYQRMLSLMFLYKIFGKNMLSPEGNLGYYPHNALGYNIDDLKEVYDLVISNYKHANEFLSAKKRTNNDLQHQTTYSFYILNKHNRHVSNLGHSYIDLGYAPYANFDVPLFCINTDGNRNYSTKEYDLAKVIMNKLFPNATKYEKPDIKNGIYTIESALNNKKVLDIEGAKATNGANLQLWEKNNTNAQKFYVEYAGKGYYTIKALCSGKYLDVEGAKKDCGANVWQYNRNKTDAQKWYIVPLRQGYWTIISKCNGLAIDVQNAMSENGTNIPCWEPNGTHAQKFKFLSVG